jgi:hypothetical protein
MEATRALGVFAGNVHAMSQTFEQGSQQIKGVQQACNMFRSALERYKAQKFSAARQQVSTATH